MFAVIMENNNCYCILHFKINEWPLAPSFSSLSPSTRSTPCLLPRAASSTGREWSTFSGVTLQE